MRELYKLANSLTEKDCKLMRVKYPHRDPLDPPSDGIQVMAVDSGVKAIPKKDDWIITGIPPRAALVHQDFNSTIFVIGSLVKVKRTTTTTLEIVE